MKPPTFTEDSVKNVALHFFGILETKIGLQLQLDLLMIQATFKQLVISG